MKYQNFTIEEFALDPFFKQWVLHPTQEAEQFWMTWLLQYPEKKHEVGEARAIVLSLDFEDDLHSYEVDEEWGKVYAKIIETSSSGFKYAGPFEERTSWWREYRTFAAVFIALMLAIGGYLIISFSGKPNYISYVTPYGETKEVTLPDGSLVTLNAASKITFSSEWDDQDARDVWMDGEAFFAVLHTKSGQKFIVHTDQESSVEVLGTKFNVYDRRSKIQVVLQEGKVQVTAKEKSSPYILSPGELVEWDKSDDNLQKQKVNTHLYTSWKEHEILFDKASLQKVAQTLEDIHGVNVVFKDPSLQTLNFTGSLLTKDVDSFLLSLSKSFKIQVRREGNQIIIGN